MFVFCFDPDLQCLHLMLRQMYKPRGVSSRQVMRECEMFERACECCGTCQAPHRPMTVQVGWSIFWQWCDGKKRQMFWFYFQVAQAETELETRWTEKAEKMVAQTEEKWKRRFQEVTDEKEETVKKLAELKEKVMKVCFYSLGVLQIELRTDILLRFRVLGWYKINLWSQC